MNKTCNAGLWGCPGNRPDKECHHEKNGYECPCCQSAMILVKDSGHMFCGGSHCEYEGNVKNPDFIKSLIGPNKKLDLLRDPEVKRLFTSHMPKDTKLTTKRYKDEHKQTMLESVLVWSLDTVFCGALVEVQATYTWRQPDTKDGRQDHRDQFCFLMGRARAEVHNLCMK